MATETTPARWRFGSAVFDEQTLELRLDGNVVAIERKALEVLRYLILRAGNVVTKDELLKAVWPGRLLSDSALTSCIFKLRNALDDADQVLIKTVHGYGYRLVAALEREGPRAAAAASAIASAQPRPAARSPGQPAEAEHRQITLLSCNLVGSTQLAQKLDPEDFRELVVAYQDTVAQVVERYEGHIAQYLGDGLQIYFGYPQAHDDNPERAVRAGWEILATLARLKRSPALQARIGIHTGPVVVGQTGGNTRGEMLAMGATTNVAARLQAIAKPNTVVVSAATHKLVPGLFVMRNLGPRPLEGIDEPMPAFELVQPSGVRTRLEASAKLTPFVGRTEELTLLAGRWERASDGEGQCVLLSAEPGFGKSRLLVQLRASIATTPHTWLECRCSPMTRNSAFAPTVELLHQGLQLRDTDDDATKLERLERALDLIGQDKAEAVPLLAPLLNLALHDPYRQSPYGPELAREKTLQLLVSWTLALAQHQPLLLAIEDLHWADPSSVELLKLMIGQLPGHKIMAVFTARPEFQPPWPVRAHVAILALQPLRARDVSMMLGSLASDRSLPEAVQRQIVERTGGVPLFVEEMTKALLESGHVSEQDGKLVVEGGIETLAVPATLRDSLTARIDRLGDARSLLQLCSVIGRDIPHALLAAVADVDEVALLTELAALADAQLLYVRGSPPQATYLFKHALIQDAAYQSLLRATREKLHARVANALRDQFPARAKAEPERLATHLEKGGLTEPAIESYLEAADVSASRLSIKEMIVHLKHSLELLEALPDGPKRRQFALRAQVRLAHVYTIELGFAHIEVDRALDCAQQIWETDTDADPEFVSQAMSTRWFLLTNRAEHHTAQTLALQMHERATRRGSSYDEALAWNNRGFNAAYLGRPVEARDCMARAYELVSVQGSHGWFVEPTVSILASRAIPERTLGYLDRSLQFAKAAMARAEELQLPYSIAYAGILGLSSTHSARREWDAALAAAQKALEVSTRFGLRQFIMLATQQIAFAQAFGPTFEASLAVLRNIHRMSLASGFRIHRSVFLTQLTERCLLAGRAELAGQFLDEAYALMNETDERLAEAEFHRMQAEWHLAQPTPRVEPAEAALHKALDLARIQQARLYELRAAYRLAQLWEQRNQHREAYELLAPIYGWFTEGFDTADLKDARALLDDLKKKL